MFHKFNDAESKPEYLKQEISEDDDLSGA